MDEFDKWEELVKPIKQAAKILNIDLTEADLPEYLNWKVGADMHRKLWDKVYAKRKKK